ncbi:MAG: ROK family protein [Coriobacteriia bacterium]|nr:ROK family protein [Coriobacteriia bacterium]
MRIVFDIGGTSLRYVKYVDGAVVAQAKEPTPSYKQGHTSEEVNQQLLDAIARAIGASPGSIDEIGICYAGPVSASGHIVGSPTIHGTKLAQPYDLQSAVQTLTGISRVRVVNDLSAAAYRYIDDYDSFELVTVSTSVGNKIVIDKQLQLGSQGLEGELGHVPAFLPSPFSEDISLACSCGFGNNHIGAVSSGSGIADVAALLKSKALKESFACSPLAGSKSLSAEEIAAASAKGDAFACSVIDVCTYPLAYAICLTLSSLYLEKIVLMGGVIANCPYYYDSLMQNILDIGVYNYSQEHLTQKVIKGALDDDSGLIGMNCYLDSIS